MDTDKTQKPFPWGTAIIAAAAVIIAAFALVAYLKTARGVKDTVDKVIGTVPEIARNFMTGNITHTFRESLPRITSTKGDILELAVFRCDETFKRTDEKWAGWGWVYLGTTVAEIRVPVSFRYHLRLSDPWRLAARDQVCLVLAPPIRPSLPPAIHTAEMERRAESGWARFDKNEQLETLERSMTPLLEQRAGDSAHLQLVREACRHSVAEFVQKWLMREGQWQKDKFTSIVVLFPDEAAISSDQDLLRFRHEPTLRLEKN
ncbi:MAG TPA: hypothetical protein P5205_09015 [Candidatus Paceibacterota bacterium]|nr:hypothetical protein [Verrucomicrobiota bacterium]HSA10496.1 hypothetical protein [Candidatus Paceibacterota bacterium]